jgi:hypothetical protein
METLCSLTFYFEKMSHFSGQKNIISINLSGTKTVWSGEVISSNKLLSPLAMTFQIVCGIFYTTFESFHPAGIASPFTTARTFSLVFCGHNLLEFLEKNGWHAIWTPLEP